ncbi:unnamed protein product [Eretmochelys imbricata]
MKESLLISGVNEVESTEKPPQGKGDTGVTWATETGRLQFQPQSNLFKFGAGFNFKL